VTLEVEYQPAPFEQAPAFRFGQAPAPGKALFFTLYVSCVYPERPFSNKPQRRSRLERVRSSEVYVSDEQQLNRSVLEAKKADELKAIAAAVGVSLSGRPTKAGVIDQILNFASGGAPAPASPDSGNGGSTAASSTEERPRRTRRSSKPAQDDGSESSDSGTSTAGESSEAPAGSGDAKPATEGDKPSEDTSGAASANGSSTNASDSNGSGGGEGRQNNQGREPREGGKNNRNRNRNDREGRGDRNDREGRGFDTYAGNSEAGESGGRNSRRRRGRRGREKNEGGANYDQRVEQAEANFQGEPIPVTGQLELRDEGFGFLRTKGYLPSNGDVYVPVSQVRKYGLRKGDQIEGTSRPAASNEKYPALLSVTKVSGLDPEAAKQRPRFEDLTPLFPDSKLVLERQGDPGNMTARIVDLMSPIGKGQRGLIVSPPKAGKTTVMKHIAHSIEANNPEVHLMVLLVDERPEEVTDMKRSIKGEVIASTFDRPAEEHTKVAELALDRAKRLVEVGIDVVIILDGITRLARAYNLAAPASGRILSGGVDSGALYPPKKFFGSARNIEEGGSLTILATALVDTGSKMDEVIFEEFKGTGNMELKLDRKLAERRLYPAIDANGSSTRHEELLFERTQLQQVWKLRRVLNALAQDGNTAAGLELLMDKIKTTNSNDEFLAEIAKNPTPGA
jgi:transcription termination factor Rho